MEKVICLFRIRCQREAIAALLQLFYSDFVDNGIVNPNMYNKFYSYVGSISKGLDWARVLSSLDAKDANPGALRCLTRIISA